MNAVYLRRAISAGYASSDKWFIRSRTYISIITLLWLDNTTQLSQQQDNVTYSSMHVYSSREYCLSSQVQTSPRLWWSLSSSHSAYTMQSVRLWVLMHACDAITRVWYLAYICIQHYHSDSVKTQAVQQFCLMNSSVYVQKYANDAKTAARNSYFIAFYMCRPLNWINLNFLAWQAENRFSRQQEQQFISTF